MRLIDADELIEHAWRDKLDSRELIAQMIATAPTIKEIPTKLPKHIFERLLELAESDDCISRKQAIEEADKLCLETGYDNEKVIEMLNELPPATPQEPRKGYWIPTYGNVECSVCGSVKDSREVGKATHYCDFCGAKMDEPRESEDV